MTVKPRILLPSWSHLRSLHCRKNHETKAPALVLGSEKLTILISPFSTNLKDIDSYHLQTNTKLQLFLDMLKQNNI